MNFNLSEILNEAKSFLDVFYKLTGLSSIIVDLNGVVLLRNGSNNLCDFYKENLVSDLECNRNAEYIVNGLLGGKEYIVHECSEGLAFIGVPIRINNEIIAAVVLGGFWKDNKKSEELINKARNLGFSEEDYSDLIKEIPIVNEEKLKGLINFLVQVSTMFEKKVVENRGVYKEWNISMTNREKLICDINSLLNSARERSEIGAIYLIDLDDFCKVNRSLGFSKGDNLLKAISEKLMLCFSDECRIYRFGGDEFLLLEPYIENKERSIVRGKEIVNTFNDEWIIDNEKINITASIGIKVIDELDSSIDDIIRHANIAVNYAKHRGKNRYKVFDRRKFHKVLNRIELESDLKGSIENNELELYYQPQLNLKTAGIDSVEALLRWNHPHRGIIYPMEFIPLAEEVGLITEIGLWVLKAACNQVKRWKSQNLELKVAINISPIQLKDPNFYYDIVNVLSEFQIDPKYLEVEITENIFMESKEPIIDVLAKIKKRGITISIDDFGTGYSSLSYLKKLPIDIIKIDKSFVDDISNKDADKSIVGEIIGIAHKLGIEVVAEGVENQGQLNFLKEKGCDKVQGYIISRPMPISEINEYIKAQ